MKKMTIQDAELLAQRFRTETGISFSEPINVKTLLRKYNILTMYRPLSNESYGIIIRTGNARVGSILPLLTRYFICFMTMIQNLIFVMEWQL